jgi:NAD(P)-dependent dehydrogenase (short-subunit alcohol dehydrogenase family)
MSNEQEQEKALFRPDSTYLVTGGLGGVGLRTAQWMTEQGARHLVLIGRSGASEDATATLQAMREAGVSVYVMKVDIAQERQLADALGQIRHKLPPLLARYLPLGRRA